MPTILVDSHALHWAMSEPTLLSSRARRDIEAADIAVSAITWFELARMVRNGRIAIGVPLRAWLEGLAKDVDTIGISPAVAETGASLPTSFSNDPADRIIYATAIEYGLKLVTKDGSMRAHKQATTIW